VREGSEERGPSESREREREREQRAGAAALLGPLLFFGLFFGAGGNLIPGLGLR
jgi:hypothetical protein